MSEEQKPLIQRTVKRFTDKLPARFRQPGFLQFIRYGIAGGLTTLVNLGIYAFLREVPRLGENISETIAVVSSVVFAYFPNKFFVFRARCGSRRELFREALSFFTSRGATAVLEFLGVALLITELRLHEQIGVSDFWVKAMLTVAVILLNFLLSKVIVFRVSKEK